MTVGDRIKMVRKAKGLTQKDLGILSGTSEGTVRQYEIGKRQPRLEQLLLIADALGVSSGELIGEDKSPYDEFEKITKILKCSGISFEVSNIFDDYFIWPSDSKYPQEDKIEIAFSDLSKIVLSTEQESEMTRQKFVKEQLYRKFFAGDSKYRLQQPPQPVQETRPDAPPPTPGNTDTTPAAPTAKSPEEGG